MQYSVEYRVYHRPFARPLSTNHGQWQVRSGILLRVQAESGQVRYGEIAPLEWFGTESLAEAIAHCEALPSPCSEADLRTTPDHRPACQFGLESVLESFSPSPLSGSLPANSVLLPTGQAALDTLLMRSTSESSTFKWKIGVASLADELAWFDRLVELLPDHAQLRLDANGGLSWAAAVRWLKRCDRAQKVEFLEQPLSLDQFDAMVSLSQQFQTAIALDESVASLDQLEACLDRGWSGVVVLKAAIAGSPHRLRQISQGRSLDVVWSSVFETAIAQRYMLERLIPSIPVRRARALGFGVNQWFNDGWSSCSDEWLWQRLCPPDQSSNVV
ncbi:MAG: o-succinylbenzoate synthase [Synechococcales cyanobacterium T60_A2020_003]|nr:o-succinylbenzoate synthase [Synechococcales cyanobacterium T60_A2020_003]